MKNKSINQVSIINGEDGSGRGLARALRIHQRFRKAACEERDRDRQILSPHQPGGAAQAVQRKRQKRTEKKRKK